MGGLFLILLIQILNSVMSSGSKILVLLSGLLLSSFPGNGQTNNNPQAIVTIVGGDPVQSTNTNDFVNNDVNPYQDNNTNSPPSNNQNAALNQPQQQAVIEPSLENGFHVRFQIESNVTASTEKAPSAGGYMSSGSSAGSGKSPKHTVTMTERSFNFKKKMRSWLPKHKKKYRPHLCGRF